jgi:hypothetical protein
MGIASKWGVLASVALGAAVVGAWTATAQEGPASADPGGETRMSFEQEANLSPQEQLGWADEKYGVIVQTQEYAARLLASARQEDRPDIVRINCLNNKLMEINAQIQSFDDRRTSLREAINLGDNDRRRHEYRVLVVVYQKIQTLRMEVEACIGSTGPGGAGAEITVIRDPGLTPEDLTELEIPEPMLDRPPHASPSY